MGRGPWLPGRWGVGAAPSAGAAYAFPALRRRVGSAAAQIPSLLRHRQKHSLLFDRVVGSDLWAQDGARLVALSCGLGRYHRLDFGCNVGRRDPIRVLEMAPDPPQANHNTRWLAPQNGVIVRHSLTGWRLPGESRLHRPTAWDRRPCSRRCNTYCLPRHRRLFLVPRAIDRPANRPR
jgi:hypothetical protein